MYTYRHIYHIYIHWKDYSLNLEESGELGKCWKKEKHSISFVCTTGNVLKTSQDIEPLILDKKFRTGRRLRSIKR